MLGCRTSLKSHSFHSHVTFVFGENLGVGRDKQGEAFYQDIITVAQRCRGRWNPAMLGECFWFLERQDETVHQKKI
jgi:hypothetical protein